MNLLMTKGLLLAVGVTLSTSGLAQGTPASSAAPATGAAKPEKTVEGATVDKVAQIERCQGHKFESMIEIDAVKKRSTRVKLCANPGSSDADWVKTLEAAIGQIEQRDLPAQAKDKLIGELRAEMAKFGAKPARPAVVEGLSAFTLGGAGTGKSLIEPTERFETSTLPPIPPRKVAASGKPGIQVPRQPPMRIRLKCLERGESGAGGTCDFFDRNTVLALSAVEGLEGGGVLRFRRRGETQDEIILEPMQAGQTRRVKLPGELCRGISHSKVEIELLGPKSVGIAAARYGPFGLRC